MSTMLQYIYIYTLCFQSVDSYTVSGKVWSLDFKIIPKIASILFPQLDWGISTYWGSNSAMLFDFVRFPSERSWPSLLLMGCLSWIIEAVGVKFLCCSTCLDVFFRMVACWSLFKKSKPPWPAKGWSICPWVNLNDNDLTLSLRKVGCFGGCFGCGSFGIQPVESYENWRRWIMSPWLAAWRFEIGTQSTSNKDGKTDWKITFDPNISKLVIPNYDSSHFFHHRIFLHLASGKGGGKCVAFKKWSWESIPNLSLERLGIHNASGSFPKKSWYTIQGFPFQIQ